MVAYGPYLLYLKSTNPLCIGGVSSLSLLELNSILETVTSFQHPYLAYVHNAGNMPGSAIPVILPVSEAANV